MRLHPRALIPVDQQIELHKGQKYLSLAVLAALASVLCGALPAWRSSHVPAEKALKDEAASISGGTHNRRLLSGLVVAQIALSLALLVISGLFLQTLRNLSAGDPGFKQDHVLTASVGLATAGYSNDEVNAICHKILDRVAVLPTVTVASLTGWIPMSSCGKRKTPIRKTMRRVRMNRSRCRGPT